jgi:hypothetical protein
MPKSLLEEVQENASFVARCPACTQSPGLCDTNRNQMGPGGNGLHKRGRWKGLHRVSMPVCNFCQGRAVVFLNRICECGMPAVLHDDKRKVWTCGSELCISHAVWRQGASTGHYVPRSEGSSQSTQSEDWYGMHGGMGA